MSTDEETAYIKRIREFAARTPLAAWLGFDASAGNGIEFNLTFNESHIGNPAIRALHGGVIAAFLELAMQSELFARTNMAVTTANISVDYLSSSKPADMVGRVKMLRQGRRLAFMEASGWQSDQTRLVAVARACFALG